MDVNFMQVWQQNKHYYVSKQIYWLGSIEFISPVSNSHPYVGDFYELHFRRWNNSSLLCLCSIILKANGTTLIKNDALSYLLFFWKVLPFFFFLFHFIMPLLRVIIQRHLIQVEFSFYLELGLVRHSNQSPEHEFILAYN